MNFCTLLASVYCVIPKEAVGIYRYRFSYQLIIMLVEC